MSRLRTREACACRRRPSPQSRHLTSRTPGVVPVQDSKVPDGHVLLVGSVAWTEFVGAVEASAVSR
ncbi:DUF397 domain-containing protein [Streptomyces sp. NPDC058307]|uniref:DUF397 domain-containing protein n=1 Tax=Streptomyces sp. NPDC058307 TaxID=3346439 RepID=UPI0036E02E15